MTFSAKTRNVCNYKVYKKGVEQIIQILDNEGAKSKVNKILKAQRQDKQVFISITKLCYTFNMFQNFHFSVVRTIFYMKIVVIRRSLKFQHICC